MQHYYKHTHIIPRKKFHKNTHTFQKFLNAPMYTTKGYVDTLVV